MLLINLVVIMIAINADPCCIRSTHLGLAPPEANALVSCYLLNYYFNQHGNLVDKHMMSFTLRESPPCSLSHTHTLSLSLSLSLSILLPLSASRYFS